MLCFDGGGECLSKGWLGEGVGWGHGGGDGDGLGSGYGGGYGAGAGLYGGVGLGDDGGIEDLEGDTD